jgi:hypothetical protein
VAAEDTATHHHRASAARYYHQQMHPSPYAATAASHEMGAQVGGEFGVSSAAACCSSVRG